MDPVIPLPQDDADAGRTLSRTDLDLLSDMMAAKGLGPRRQAPARTAPAPKAEPEKPAALARPTRPEAPRESAGQRLAREAAALDGRETGQQEPSL